MKKVINRFTYVIVGLMVATLLLMAVNIVGLPKDFVLMMTMAAVVLQLLANLLLRERTDTNEVVRKINLIGEATIIGIWLKELYPQTLAVIFVELIIELMALITVSVVKWIFNRPIKPYEDEEVEEE